MSDPDLLFFWIYTENNPQLQSTCLDYSEQQFYRMVVGKAIFSGTVVVYTDQLAQQLFQQKTHFQMLILHLIILVPFPN
jgi:hypothetical protein